MNGLDFTRNHKLALIALVGLIAIGVSVKLARNASSAVYTGVTLREAGQSDAVGVAVSDSDATQPSDPNAGKVTFQVAGCVIAPNVYTLPRGSRIIDAIKAAGGTKIGADTESLNLAAKIEDGSRIFIPTAQQQRQATGQAMVTTGATAPATPDHVKINVIPSKSSSRSSSAGGKLRNPGDGVVRINTADITELQRLPGVGPSTAQKILDYRAQIGRFTSPEQLDDVKGIGPAKLEKMRPFVSL